MERYFLGNNTAYGFQGNYEHELKDMRRVVLLKGGPGTGKSSMLKKLAAEAKGRGFDTELWFCSGDPNSLDGVYIKEMDTAVVDATAPHATGADLPMIKDFIFDLATSLSTDKLLKGRDEIEALLKCKKKHFTRAYQHLKSALVHYRNQIELESDGLDKYEIRAFAASYSYILKRQEVTPKRRRMLYTKAISPTGENEYFDHLRNKQIYRVNGSEAGIRLFFEQLGLLQPYGTFLLDPIDGSATYGVVVGDVAIVRDVGHYGASVSENIDLNLYQGEVDLNALEEEEKGMREELALAVSELDEARKMHLAAETYFIGAMDFARNDRLYGEIKELIF